MAITYEINPGEIKIKMDEPQKGKISFADMGIKNEDLNVEGGNLRLDIELGQSLQSGNFYQMPTVELGYTENAKESGWQVEFNGEVVLEKVDHSGHKTVLFFSRNKLEDKIQHHVNRILIHGDFSEEVHISADESWIHLF